MSNKELPKLQGTEEQVSAGEQIRNRWIEYAEELVEKYPGKVHELTSTYTGDSLSLTSEEISDMIKTFAETKEQSLFYFKYGDITDQANLVELYVTER